MKAILSETPLLVGRRVLITSEVRYIEIQLTNTPDAVTLETDGWHRVGVNATNDSHIDSNQNYIWVRKHEDYQGEITYTILEP